MRFINSYTSGTVLSVKDNVLITDGLYGCFVGEVVTIFNTQDVDTECLGVVLTLEETETRVVILKGSQRSIYCGCIVVRTHNYVKTRAGFGVLGFVIDTLGAVLNLQDFTIDSSIRGALGSVELIDIGNTSPTIIQREAISTPFMTGITAIDCFIPIGCGQRELIIGDINTGKTSLAITIILNQSYVINTIDLLWRQLESVLWNFRKMLKFVPCVFVLIGKRRSEVVRIRKVLQLNDAFHYTCIVFAGADALASIQYFAAYAGCAIAEWFRDIGYHSVIVYDDLTEHAVAYRQLALLLRRPPGREAYPGDIFYIHAKLLERSSLLARRLSGGSVTALPIIETKGGDIASYIPTNVISITDGQIFLSKGMFNKGLRPSIDLGLSVSRVGSKAQYNCMKKVSNRIKQNYSLYKTYEGLASISSELEGPIAEAIKRGIVLVNFFVQKVYRTYRLYQQVLALFMISEGYIDSIEPKYIYFFFEFLFSGPFFENYLIKYPSFIFYLCNIFTDVFESSLIVCSINDYVADFNKLATIYCSFFKSEILKKMIKSSFYEGMFRFASTVVNTMNMDFTGVGINSFIHAVTK